MRNATRPWGIHSIRSMFAPGCQAGLPDGRWVMAVAEPYYLETLRERFRAAWWVFSGKAHAVVWPEAGELESALTEDLPRRGAQTDRGSLT